LGTKKVNIDIILMKLLLCVIFLFSSSSCNLGTKKKVSCTKNKHKGNYSYNVLINLLRKTNEGKLVKKYVISLKNKKERNFAQNFNKIQ
jgi:hypothetical protein